MPYHRFRFNKLVRDNVPATQRQEGIRPEYRYIHGPEYLAALTTKLQEEAAEVAEAVASGNNQAITAELADLIEVINRIVEVNHLSHAKIKTIRRKKAKIKGSFALGTFEEYVDIPTTHPEVDEFLAQREKYPYLGIVE